MKSKALAAAALSICLLAAAGCGGKKAKAPKDAVKNFVNSLLKADRDLFFSNVHYGDASKELAEAQFEMLAATMEFMTKFLKAYGSEHFEKDKVLLTEEDLGKLEIEGSGNTAVAVGQAGVKETKLIKKGGYWYVDISAEMSQISDPDKAIKAAGVMTKAIKKATGNIGKEGQDAKKLSDEFKAAILAGEKAPAGG